MEIKKGKRIIIEGGDGSGKTAVMEFLQEKLSHRADIIFTKQPGGTPIGQQIRSVLLDKSSEGMSPLAELYLFYADRAHHVETIFKPAQEAGRHVICDRADPSTVAYQVYRKNRHDIMPELIRLCAATWGVAENGLRSGTAKIFDLIILLDAPVQESLARASRARGVKGMNRIDIESFDSHERTLAGFRDMCARNLFGQWHRIDASQPLAVVRAEALSAVLGVIGE